jgi:hypothetical protein
VTQAELFPGSAPVRSLPSDAARLSREQAAYRSQTGQRRAQAHADDEQGDWKTGALVALQHYLLTIHGQTFLAEEFLAFTRKRLYRQPPDARAWGAIFTRARKLGLIEQAGTARAATSNLSPKPLWRETL